MSAAIEESEVLDDFARRLVMQYGLDAGRRMNDLMGLYTMTDEEKELVRRYYNRHVQQVKGFLFEDGRFFEIKGGK